MLLPVLTKNENSDFKNNAIYFSFLSVNLLCVSVYFYQYKKYNSLTLKFLFSVT